MVQFITEFVCDEASCCVKDVNEKIFFGSGTRLKIEPTLSLCYEASCCVNTGTQKIIFGSGTRLTIEPSE
ncbi:hypothetical protein L3Q82_021078 [Scortum barcoo]|uniref:Uncharacterized protein n=1 Tax=Scortum barcoo TaxID=214431 RepID=A0ACB8X4H9_9TELE|nr:hypothetical protein L3Q82_021078 [Scortum barcoo]